MRTRLIILVESYFQQRDYRRYGIDVLKANGLQVEVWEVFRPYLRKYAENYRPPDPACFPELRHFTRKEDIVRSLSRLGADDALLVTMSNRWETRFIFRQLARQSAYFGGLELSAFAPTSGRQQRSWGTWLDWLNRAYLRIPHVLRRTSPPNFFLLCGGNVLEPVARRLPNTAILWTHALDYDIVLETGTREGSGKADHIVFLDECVPFHPDYLTLGIAAPNSPEEYFPKLNRLFDALENQWGLPVVIAAHPRANYDSCPDYFGGRKVLQGTTGALVRDAALVITHSSVSNNFTAVYRKPLLVVTTTGISHSRYGPYVLAMAAAFGAPLLHLDTNWKLPERGEFQIDGERYIRVIEQYVKRLDTPEENTWQILSKHIHSAL